MAEEHATPEAIEKVRQEIQGLFQQIAKLSKQNIEVADYFQQFLNAVVSAMAAGGGAVWKRDPQNKPEMICQINWQATEIAEGGEDEARHHLLLEQVLAKGESLVVPPYAGNQDVGNPSRFLLILVPLRSGDAGDPGGEVIEGVVEIMQRPGASLEVQRGYLKFLQSACDKAGEWMGRRKFRQLSDEQERWRRLDAFARAAHESLHSREAAFAIANEARLYIGCDRVSVATRRGSSFRLETISGQDTIDRRSNLVVMLQTLTRRVLAAGDPFWYAGSTHDMPPQIEKALQDYVDVAHSKAIGIIPLRDAPKKDDDDDTQTKQGQIVGALVVEQIEDNRALEAVQQRAADVAPHAARGLANAHAHGSVFLMPLWRLVGHSRVLVTARNLPKTLLAVIALAIFIAVCALVPINFDLEGPAELQPVQRRDVFTAIDGVVSDVHVDTGDDVVKGQKLLTLRNTDLQVRIKDLQGRLSVANEQILEYERQLLGGTTGSPVERARWASELAGLRKQASNYTTQLLLLEERKKELVVVSPIDGEVITWDARRLLRGSYVTPGQVMLTIADTEGEWELLIHMPEDNIGYISDAQRDLKEELDVSYVLATDPGNKRTGDLRKVHQAAEPHETSGHVVKIAVDIDEDDLSHPRPGATATAQVHCGKASIAFVWLHDVVEFLQTKVFF